MQQAYGIGLAPMWPSYTTDFLLSSTHLVPIVSDHPCALSNAAAFAEIESAQVALTAVDEEIGRTARQEAARADAMELSKAREKKQKHRLQELKEEEEEDVGLSPSGSDPRIKALADAIGIAREDTATGPSFGGGKVAGDSNRASFQIASLDERGVVIIWIGIDATNDDG